MRVHNNSIAEKWSPCFLGNTVAPHAHQYC